MNIRCGHEPVVEICALVRERRRPRAGIGCLITIDFPDMFENLRAYQRKIVLGKAECSGLASDLDRSCVKRLYVSQGVY